VKYIIRLYGALIRDDRGATAIEYALIASILGIALVPVLTNTTSGIASLYTRVQGYFDKFN
jgi:Flp pilus assembly pilin Flp